MSNCKTNLRVNNILILNDSDSEQFMIGNILSNINNRYLVKDISKQYYDNN